LARAPGWQRIEVDKAREVAVNLDERHVMQIHVGNQPGETMSASRPSDTRTMVTTRSPWRGAIAAGLGSAIEYYDFQLYAVLAVSISPLFFPNQSPEAALLSTLLSSAGPSWFDHRVVCSSGGSVIAEVGAPPCSNDWTSRLLARAA
jgi:hypothetical protein